ncbi:response regulator transcription factor [Bifidobacterium vansinderenii]|uniref:Two component transcriptional regulator, LuxR family n=1 Tax=Bifidobacterium vansinderenii TaxID=1984871 RepID=A0A229VV58_9BIFI|nr:response regulator transcription factor [Bifidobacterium vansinderenii]OXM99512.1 two component transcriptional regulator, LuxR family [Bifidobacterium vansinderenii]
MNGRQNTKRRIAIVDNDVLALTALRALIEQQLPQSTVIWTTDDGQTAVDRCLNEPTRPDLLLVDMSMERMSGITVCRRIRTGTPDVKLLAVTSFTVDTYAAAAASAGAQGIVGKADVSKLCQAVETVLDGGTCCSALPAVSSEETGVPPVPFQTAQQAYERLDGGGACSGTGRDSHALSAQETTIMDLCCSGLDFTEIAERLTISPSTVRTHIGHIKTKLGARNLSQAVVRWMTGKGQL